MNSPAKTTKLPIYALFAANAISMTGNQLAALAVPWFVLATTGSATKTGISAFFSVLPVVIAAFFGGTIVDRVGYKRMSIIADIASGVTIVLIPILYMAGMLEFWVLMVLVFFGALLDAPGTTAREALIPDLAEAAGMSLERAGSLLQVVERGARLIGAPLSGVLIAAIGPQNVMWADAATFAVSAIIMAVGVPRAMTTTIEKTTASNYREELLEGLRFIGRDRLTLTILAVLMITNLLDTARAGVLYPIFAQDIYHSSVALGLMFGLSGGGAVIGALLYSAFGHRFSRRWIYAGAFTFTSIPVFIYAFAPPLWVVLVLQTLAGVAAGPLNPILSAIQYERVPPAMRGRVFGVITAGAFIAMPLGGLVAGYTVDGLGIQNALLATASIYALITVLQLFNPVLKQMERPQPQLASESSVPEMEMVP